MSAIASPRFAGLALLCASLIVQADDDLPRFGISRYQLQHATLLDAATAARLTAPYVGASRDFGDIQHAIEAIEAWYREQGYSLVRIHLPEQVLDTGVVQLEVMEATISRVEISGNKYFDDDNVRASLPALQKGAMPHLNGMSANLKIANENPSKTTRVSFLDDASRSAGVVARVEVEDEKPWSVAASWDNSGTPATGRQRVGVVARHHNLFNRDHIATVQYTTSPGHERDVQLYGVGYRLPLYGWDAALDVYANHSDVDSGTVAAGPFDLAVTGRGSSAGLRWNQALPRRGEWQHKVVLGADWRSFDNDTRLEGIQLGSKITTLPLTLGYAVEVEHERQRWLASINWSHNLPGGRYGDAEAFRQSRQDATPHYQVWRLDSQAGGGLPGDWRWLHRLGAQVSPDVLISSEQFGIGGQSSVRGYPERAEAGEEGISQQLSLYGPELCGRWTGGTCRLGVFVDAGTLRRRATYQDTPDHVTLWSYGASLQAQWRRNVQLGLDVGVPQKSTADTSRQHPRLHASLILSY